MIYEYFWTIPMTHSGWMKLILSGIPIVLELVYIRQSLMFKLLRDVGIFSTPTNKVMNPVQK
jgi:hypothetical protein